jgi:hypothetical protein
MKEGGIIAGLAFTVAPAYFVGREKAITNAAV